MQAQQPRTGSGRMSQHSEILDYSQSTSKACNEALQNLMVLSDCHPHLEGQTACSG